MTEKPAPPAPAAHAELQRLLDIMRALRTPETGCPWDLAQDFSSIAPYTIEEAYEVADAIARGDWDELKLELGDLLFQVVFHARMAEEKSLFDFSDVAAAIADKMERRHPHVFGDEAVDDIRANWEDMKARERAEKSTESESVLDGVPTALPGLTRAVKLQQRAARVGFDWKTAAPILDKLGEEIGELTDEMNAPQPAADRLADELGDVLFVVANLARRLDIDPEAAIRAAGAKFERRFRRMETQDDLNALDLDALEALWQKAKADET